jgi:hypothetical protein
MKTWRAVAAVAFCVTASRAWGQTATSDEVYSALGSFPQEVRRAEEARVSRDSLPSDSQPASRPNFRGYDYSRPNVNFASPRIFGVHEYFGSNVAHPGPTRPIAFGGYVHRPRGRIRSRLTPPNGSGSFRMIDPIPPAELSGGYSGQTDPPGSSTQRKVGSYDYNTHWGFSDRDALGGFNYTASDGTSQGSSTPNSMGGYDYIGPDGSNQGYTTRNTIGGVDFVGPDGLSRLGWTRPNSSGGYDYFGANGLYLGHTALNSQGQYDQYGPNGDPIGVGHQK